MTHYTVLYYIFSTVGKLKNRLENTVEIKQNISATTKNVINSCWSLEQVTLNL